MVVDELTARLADERSRAVATYSEILSRAGAPRRGDVDKLRDVLTKLGKVPTDVDRDIECQRAHVARAAALAERDAATATLSTATQTFRAAESQFAERERALLAERDAALTPLNAARNAIHGTLAAANSTLRQTENDALEWEAFTEGIDIDTLRARRRRFYVPPGPTPRDETPSVPIGTGAADAGSETFHGQRHGETIPPAEPVADLVDVRNHVAQPVGDHARRDKQAARRAAFENLPDDDKREVVRRATPRV